MNEKLQGRHFDRFILIGRIEALSFLVLVLIAMPLKYMAGMPLMVKYVGWAHGVLFVIYVAQLLYLSYIKKWSLLWIFYGGVAALVPLGPIAFEWYLQKRIQKP